MADNGITPDMLRALLAAYSSAGPQFDSKGRVKPQGLDYQRALLNYQQDLQRQWMDPIQGGLSGGYDPSVFADVPSGKTQDYQLPSDPLAPYMSLPDGSMEKVIATGIAEGRSPSQIAADWGGSNADAVKEAKKLATDLFQGQHQFESQISQIPGFEKDKSGQWVYNGPGTIAGGKVSVPIMERSPAAKAFDAAGLPTPDQKFTPADFGGGQYGDVLSAKKDELAKLQAQRNADKTSWQGLKDRANSFDAAANAAVNDPTNIPPQEHLKGGLGNALGHAFLGWSDKTVTPGDTPVTRLDAVWKQGGWTPDTLFAAHQAQAGRGPESDQYRKSAMAETLARKQLEQLQFSSKANDAYAQAYADTLQKAGMSPLMLAMARRVRGGG